MTTSEVEKLSPLELQEAWPALSDEERQQGFGLLTVDEAEEFLLHLTAHDSLGVLVGLPPAAQRRYLRLLPPDDLADLIQEAPPERREAILELLDGPARAEIRALLAYEEDEAGGLMNPRFARLRPDMTVEEAISYLRRLKSHTAELIYYGYVVDADQRLVGVVSFRELVTAPPQQKLRDLMTTELVTVPEDMDQEEVSHVFARADMYCLPVVDADGRMKGIVTADDIVDVVKEEATEDMHKLGGSGALEAPYLDVSVRGMIRKRFGWLTVLFLGQMLTASVIGVFEQEIARAVVLALFIPLIISTGGNSGSQASTLVVRAMALGEVRLRDWWVVLRRELAVGALLGLLLSPIGLGRVLAWQGLFGSYGEHYVLIGLTVAGSVIGVVLWGTTMGAMLPMILRRLGFDPASASAPFVATLVDVTGLIIYFTVASLILHGTLL
jgi:magnesium transporter